MFVQTCLAPVAYDLTIEASEVNLPIEATSDKNGDRLAVRELARELVE